MSYKTTKSLEYILELLPESIQLEDLRRLNLRLKHKNGKWVIDYYNRNQSFVRFYGDSPMIVSNDMFCWCIENGYINKDKYE